MIVSQLSCWAPRLQTAERSLESSDGARAGEKVKCLLHAAFLQVCICELQIVQAQMCVTVFHDRDLRMFYCDDTCLRIRKLLRKSGSEGCWEQIAHHSCLQTDKTFKNQTKMNIIEKLVLTDLQMK